MKDHPPLLQPHQIWTGSGYLDAANPDPDEVFLSDIARGLSLTFRFGGAATRIPWSVAQHSLLCLEYAREDGVSDPRLLLTILLHDAPEAYLGDLPRPIKTLPEMDGYREIEDRFWRAIALRFDLPQEMPEAVGRYDRLALRAEAEAFVDSPIPFPPVESEEMPRVIPRRFYRQLGEPAAARRAFSREVRNLEKERKR